MRGHGDRTPGDVTAFHGAAHAVRASVYRAVGGYPDELFYGHEETDLAWRILDAGYTIAYRPDLVLEHPRTKPSRHRNYLWYFARNRVWIARRNLPFPLIVDVSGGAAFIQLAAVRALGEVNGVVARGTVAGIRSMPPAALADVVPHRLADGPARATADHLSSRPEVEASDPIRRHGRTG